MFWWAVALSRTPEEWKVASEMRWLWRMVLARLARVDAAAVASAAKPGEAGPIRLAATVATSSSAAHERRLITTSWNLQGTFVWVFSRPPLRGSTRVTKERDLYGSRRAPIGYWRP